MYVKVDSYWQKSPVPLFAFVQNLSRKCHDLLYRTCYNVGRISKGRERDERETG